MSRNRMEGGGEACPNMAPLVDVVMVLLVFFLLNVSIQFAEEGILQTELDPSSGPGEGVAVALNPTIQIALEDVRDGEGCNIYVMEEPLDGNSFDDLLSFMAARKRLGADTTNAVVIGAGMSVRWKYVVKAMDATVRAGFRNVQFAVSFDDT